MISPTSTIPLRGAPIAVLDFETTGVDPRTCHPVQVAVATCRLGESEPEVAFRTLIRPPSPIPEAASAIHDITDADVADAPTMAEALPDLLSLLNGRVLAAYNLPFDWQILARFAPSIPFGSICGFVLARAIDKFERGKKLSDVASRRGIRFDAHDAGSDALTTARLLPVLLRELARGKERQDRYGRTHKDGPWCEPADLRSVGALWRWTLRAGAEQEADLDAYFRREKGRGLDAMPWTQASKEAA